ncbi:MAG: hypothetical protein AAFX39_14850 [Pseudomonadota bacterium]
MFKTLKTFALAAAASAVLLAGQAQAQTFTTGFDDADIAVSTCWAATGFASIDIEGVVHDGVGGFVVWISDTDETLYLCNADATGTVYAFDPVSHDMFNGKGQDALGEAGFTEISTAVSETPQAVANTICTLPFDETIEIVASVPDGLGDYLIWMVDGDETYWMCNASGEAQVYTLTPIDGAVVTIEGMQQA